MLDITVSGVKRFNAYTKKISANINNKFAPELIDEGEKYAKKTAPIDTGATIRAISKISKKSSAKLVLNQPMHPESGKTRPYHLWMHGIKAPSQSSGGAGSGYDTSKGKYSPKSGEPDFMYKSYDYMLQKYNEVFDDIFRKTK